MQAHPACSSQATWQATCFPWHSVMLTTETFEIKRLLTLSLAALCKNREEILPLRKETATTSTLPSDLALIVIVNGICIYGWIYRVILFSIRTNVCMHCSSLPCMFYLTLFDLIIVVTFVESTNYEAVIIPFSPTSCPWCPCTVLNILFSHTLIICSCFALGVGDRVSHPCGATSRIMR